MDYFKKQLKTFLGISLIVLTGLTANLLVAPANNASAFMDECEDDVCVTFFGPSGEVTTCSDHSTVPSSEEGYNCDAPEAGEEHCDLDVC